MTDEVFSASEAEDGERLDRFLARRTGTSRNQVQQWIADGRVRVGERVQQKPSTPVSAADLVHCKVPPPRAVDPRVIPEEGPLAVLYEDSSIVVVDKPAGLVVHPGAGHDTGTLVHRLLARYPEMTAVGGVGRPGIVHRLDRGTSGVMVVARTVAAYGALTTAFAERRVRKTYVAVVHGSPRNEEGTIDAPIGRHPDRRQEMAVRGDGRSARTNYRTVVCSDNLAGGVVSLLRVEIATGRTHQIRVHLKSVGHPLIGDPVYGERRWKDWPRHRQASLRSFSRPALHAWRLGLDHPSDGSPRTFTAPAPPDLRQLWETIAGKSWPAELL